MKAGRYAKFDPLTQHGPLWVSRLRLVIEKEPGIEPWAIAERFGVDERQGRRNPLARAPRRSEAPVSRRRLPFVVPSPRAYSSTPTAVRSRRHRERQRQAALACRTDRGDRDLSPTTSWFCICGWQYIGVGTMAATVGAFECHVKSCLFGEPLQVIVRRRARVAS